MPVSVQWHPVAPAQALRAADNVLACTVSDQPLALWRSASGQVQAWEDRCPHRGVALSLGRIQGERLACAYHGWEYAAGSERCVAIPAMPDQPVPGRVCVKTFAALEHQGMVWVGLAPNVSAQVPPAHDKAAQPFVFLRSVGVNAAPATVNTALASHGYRRQDPHQWSGMLDGHAVHVFVLSVSDHLCLLHLACPSRPLTSALPGLFGAIRRLRGTLENTTATD